MHGSSTEFLPKKGINLPVFGKITNLEECNFDTCNDFVTFLCILMNISCKKGCDCVK